MKETKAEPNKGYQILTSMSLNGEKKIQSLGFYNFTDEEITMENCPLFAITLYGDDRTSTDDRIMYFSKSEAVKYDYNFYFNEDSTLEKLEITLPTTMMDFS